MIDLSGTWQFALDRDDVGIEEAWFNLDLPNPLQLPGSLQEQGFGDEITVETPWVGSVFDDDWFTQERYAPYRQPGNIKVPFWLQPQKYYTGVAWYRRTFEIPAEWSGVATELTLERTHWGTRVWIDGHEVGNGNHGAESLSAPHVYNLGVLSAGTHILSLRVDNRMLFNVGPNAHSVSDHTQTNWNGIVGEIALRTLDPVRISRVEISPQPVDGAVALTLTILDERIDGAAIESATLAITATMLNALPLSVIPLLVSPVDITERETKVELAVPLGDEIQLWDEYNPVLYALTFTLSIEADGLSSASQTTRVTGFRSASVEGRRILVNGKPIYLRGTLECCIFPLTGYPATDLASWQRIFRICQEHGLNHVRFHSWCPPEAAFVAADAAGVYLQVECASWANLGSALGEGDPVDQWLYREGDRIVSAYGHHPSFLLMAYGNEPGVKHFEKYLAEWVAFWKQRDPARLHTSGAGWPALPENDFHCLPEARIQQWGDQLNSRINALPPETTTAYSADALAFDRPLISHEVGQWCVYPDFDEIAKYTGVLRAHNFEIFRDFLNAAHMGDQARDFLLASGKLQALCYKEEIEALLRTADLAGFQLLDLHDFPGQGTALIGVLDPFWDEKPYIHAAAFKRFCAPVVPLVRLPKRYWRSGEELVAQAQVAHWGAADLFNAHTAWRIENGDGAIVAQGSLPGQMIQRGGVRDLGEIRVPLANLTTAQKYTLFVAIEEAGVENDWDIWLFADTQETSPPSAVQITSLLDETTLATLRAGGSVLLALPAEQVNATSVLGFSSAFWNTSWTRASGQEQNWPNGQAPHTLGILCNPAHPLFAHFPTEYHSNWQWWELIHGAAAMTLTDLPPDFRPIVQPIDTWFEARRLGLLLEAQVEGGKLIVCSMDIHSALDERLVARQMRHAMLQYMQSEDFAPRHSLTLDEVRSLLRA